MKSSIKQISEDISGALLEVISIKKVSKKLEKTIEKSSRKIAKKVDKLRKKEDKEQKKAEKLAIRTTRILVPKVAKTKAVQLPIMKTNAKKTVAVPKARPVKLKTTS